MRIVLIITLCLMPLTAQAAWLQFDPTTGNVTGIDDVPRPAEGRDVVEFPGVTATDFAWPVPSGCAAGEPSWTRVVNRALVEASDLAGLAIRPDGLLFTTTSTLLPGCHRVHGWQQLKILTDEAMLVAMRGQDRVEPIALMNEWYQAQGVERHATSRALQDVTATQCATWKGSLDIINTRIAGRGQGVTLSGLMATRVTDAHNFRDIQPKAGRPGW